MRRDAWAWTQSFPFSGLVPPMQSWLQTHLLSFLHGHWALVLSCVEETDVCILAHCRERGWGRWAHESGGTSQDLPQAPCGRYACLRLRQWSAFTRGHHPDYTQTEPPPTKPSPFHDQVFPPRTAYEGVCKAVNPLSRHTSFEATIGCWQTQASEATNGSVSGF